MNHNSEYRDIFGRVLICILILSLSTLPAESTTRNRPEYPVFQKGMSYAAWDKYGYSTERSDRSLASMTEAGVTCVAIVVTWYQKDFNSVNMRPTVRTPSDESLRHVIRKARECGMAVMLKPHIDLEEQDGSCWRADIGFQTEEQWERWFGNYSRFLNHYARIAEEEGVEFFCVGTELSFAAGRTRSWKEIVIPRVREIFSGQITYAANWDNYSAVRFWDALDYAGLNAYFPLSEKYGPSYDEIKKGWKRWMGEIERWQRSIDKPVVFTECGYCSTDLAAVNPWAYGVKGAPSPSLQADCYRAVLETFWNKPWFSGIYWWVWDTSEKAGGIDNIHFTPQNKPALELVRSWYLMTGREEAVLCDACSRVTGVMAFFVHALTIFHNISKYVIIISPNIC